MQIDVTDPVVWPDDPDRQQWWASVLGIDSSAAECAAADLIEQHRVVVFDDDGYPPTPHPAVTAATAA